MNFDPDGCLVFSTLKSYAVIPAVCLWLGGL